MRKKIFILVALVSILVSSTFAQNVAPSPARSADSSARSIACQVMEVFVAPRQGVNAIIFHQRDKTDGPWLGELLKSYSGQEMEFETTDGQRHRATVARMKNCFGRGLLIFASGEAKLVEKEEFALRFPEKNELR